MRIRGGGTATRGGILVMTLVFVVMFTTIFIGLSGLVNRTFHESVLQSRDETAFQIAEAGLDYGRWRLAHNIDDLAAETKTVTDQFAGDLGEFDVTFQAPDPGSTVVLITSVGTTAEQPGREVTLRARYGRPSLARFASVTNQDVWYGGTIVGSVHSNGGIRMDGSANSTMSSARETYPCQPYHGCNNPFETKDGVWGIGTIQELWEFPVPAIDYNAITLDLLDMKAAAQAAGTYYDDSTALGYQVVFNSDNTVTISRVISLTSPRWSYWSTTGWQYVSHDVGSTVTVETVNVPSNGVLYFEDRIWVRGDIRDRVTVAAGVFPDNPSTHADIILNGDISYGGVLDGTRSFAAVAQRHVQIPYSGAPDTMDLDGAFVAQQGSFHRRYYSSGSHRLKTSLTRYGMLASNGVPATAWVNGSGTVISGFQGGSSTYDPNLLYGPPPYFPTSGQYEFISWEEQQ